MVDFLTASLNFLAAAITSEAVFVAFSFIVIFIESVALYASIVVLVNRTIMGRRKELGMNEVDQAMQAIRKVFISHYLTIAKKQLGDDYFNRKETALYRYLITLTLDELKPRYRARIRRNHFNEKTPGEWSKYVHDCIEDDIKAISNYLDEHYHPQAKITRPDLYEWNMQRIDEIKAELDDLFSQLLCIAEKNQLRRFFGNRLELGAET